MTSTKSRLLISAKNIFATNGYDGLSMRALSKSSGVNLSTIYHYFEDKDQLLGELFKLVGKELGDARQGLPVRTKASEAMRDRIAFQFDHIEDVVFVLKYYLHYRAHFSLTDRGYIPDKAYLHIKEVLEIGVKTKEFGILTQEIDKKSKVIAHAINGFLLEYYPLPPNQHELDEIINDLHSFIVRGLEGGRKVMI